MTKQEKREQRAKDRELDLDAAFAFLERCCIEPRLDIAEQLVDGFLPALRVMHKRGFSPDGRTWQGSGWRSHVFEIMKRADRIAYNSWRSARFDKNDAVDLINFCGFYIRMRCQGEPWSKWGEPGE
jgi:hypothetical protein